MNKRINFWLILISGLVFVLVGVTLRIGNKSIFSAILIILGMIQEITAAIFLISKALRKNR